MAQIAHAFTLTFRGKPRQILTEVSASEAFEPPAKSAIKIIKAVALWDTGATQSCFSLKSLEDIGAGPITFLGMNHAGGKDLCGIHSVNIFLPNGVCIVGVEVIGLPHLTGPFDAIIGMDIISRGDFAITHENNESFVSFRIPPVRKIDFVEENQA